MLKKGARFLKIISLIGIVALLGGVLRSGAKINDNLLPTSVDALSYYAESMGYYSISDAFKKGVRKTHIAKITASRAETFSGNTIDDYSRPTNSYLPKGTIDYCDPKKITDPVSGRQYYKLSSGYRIYADDDSAEITEGYLKGDNSLSFSFSKKEGKKLLLGFKTEERVPFKLSYSGQDYRSESAPDYSVSSCNFSFIDITFFNSESLDIGGLEIPENHIFSKGEQLESKNKHQVSVRLHLKKAGAFYGWDARYNEAGDLVFSFLLPPTLKKDDSTLGFSLEGIKILIDPGHGGDDPGAPNLNGSYKYGEQNYALLYAKQLSNELRALGATVTFTRTSNTTVDLDDRCTIIRNSNADLVISIHFNSSKNKDRSGFFTGYFCPFGYPAAKSISNALMKAMIFSPENGGINWHYFRLSRVTSCPVILTENGYISNEDDYQNIRSPKQCEKYIQCLAKGICDYFALVSE